MPLLSGAKSLLSGEPQTHAAKAAAGLTGKLRAYPALALLLVLLLVAAATCCVVAAASCLCRSRRHRSSSSRAVVRRGKLTPAAQLMRMQRGGRMGGGLSAGRFAALDRYDDGAVTRAIAPDRGLREHRAHGGRRGVGSSGKRRWRGEHSDEDEATDSEGEDGRRAADEDGDAYDEDDQAHDDTYDEARQAAPRGGGGRVLSSRHAERRSSRWDPARRQREQDLAAAAAIAAAEAEVAAAEANVRKAAQSEQDAAAAMLQGDSAEVRAEAAEVLAEEPRRAAAAGAGGKRGAPPRGGAAQEVEQAQEHDARATERRYDLDGQLYTMAEFVGEYGGQDEWDMAEPEL